MADFKKNDLTELKKKRFATFKDLGVLEYKKALKLQIQMVAAMHDQTVSDPLRSFSDHCDRQDTILFVEHPTVFTVGKRGGLENLTVSQNFLKSKNIDIIKTDRGGNITWHGPGQAVLYPIIDLQKNKIGVKDFVHGLEEIMKLTLSDFNIKADRNKKNHGIWVGNSKIGSIGLSIKKGISMHGLALNVNPDLQPFSWINPCGLDNISMTSIQKEINHKKEIFGENQINMADFKNLNSSSSFNMERIKECFIKYFSSLFNFEVFNT